MLTKRSEDCRERHLQPSRIQLPLTSPASSETPCLLLAPSRSCAISHLYVPALLSFLCLKSTSFLPPPLSTVILMSGSSSNINMQASLLGSAAHDGGGQKPTRRPPCPGPWISQLPFLYLVSSSLNNNYDDNIYITWLLRIKPVHLSRMLIKIVAMPYSVIKIPIIYSIIPQLLMEPKHSAGYIEATMNC